MAIATLKLPLRLIVVAGVAGWVAAAGGAQAVTLPSATEAPAPAENLPLKERAARRFPQWVSVAALGHRQVIEPSNHQGHLGYVAGVARTPDGDIKILMRHGGFLGLGARVIAVPVEATGLLGQFLEVLDLDQQQLDRLPDWQPADGVALGDNERIRIGLTKN